MPIMTCGERKDINVATDITLVLVHTLSVKYSNKLGGTGDGVYCNIPTNNFFEGKFYSHADAS